MANSTKKCKVCEQDKLKSEFVSQFGFDNPRGRLCRDCWIEKQKNEVVELMEGRDYCLYCNTSISRARDYDANGQVIRTYVHMDHMDPLALGGYDPYTYDLEIEGFPENISRNTVYCCGDCNSKKKDMPFKDWLKLIPEKNRELARKVYVEKNGMTPEEFVAHEDVVIRIEFDDGDGS